MAEILLFHHAQGLTGGCLAFAGDLRAAGHVVHAPDLYDGRTFDSLSEGVGHAQEIGFGTVIARGVAVAEDLPAGSSTPASRSACCRPSSSPRRDRAPGAPC